MSEIHLTWRALVQVWPLGVSGTHFLTEIVIVVMYENECISLFHYNFNFRMHLPAATSTSKIFQDLPRSSKHFRGLASAIAMLAKPCHCQRFSDFFCSALRRRFCWRRRFRSRFRSRFRRGVDRVCRVCGRRPPETVLKNQLADPSWSLTKIS